MTKPKVDELLMPYLRKIWTDALAVPVVKVGARDMAADARGEAQERIVRIVRAVFPALPNDFTIDLATGEICVDLYTDSDVRDCQCGE